MEVSEDHRPRSERRREGPVEGTVRRAGAEHPALFENVSASGCCIVGDFPIGETVVATMPEVGTVVTRVRWSIGGRSGLQVVPGTGADEA